jgi:hypothetical protein
MRCSHLVVLAAAALAACGGSWSNVDLQYASALPQRSVLRSKLSTAAAADAGQPSSAHAVGDPSQAYLDAKSAQTNFNGILDFFLAVLDTVRALPPSSRTADTRTWGPYPDSNNTGYEFSVTVHQLATDTFAWALTAQPTSGGATLTVVDGAFTATTTAAHGHGQLAVHLADFKAQLAVDGGLEVLDLIAIEYHTDASPLTVAMTFTFQPGATSNLAAWYDYLERDDHSGALHFVLDTSSPQTTELDTTAQWTAAGAGETVQQVKAGLYAGASITECWDAQFKLSYYLQSWTGGQLSGTPGACPTFTTP